MEKTVQMLLLISLLSILVVGFSQDAKAASPLLSLGTDNVYYQCQGKVITPQTDDRASEDRSAYSIDPGSVKIINDAFFTDKNGVYYVSTYNYYCYFYKLIDADANSFRILNDLYQKDKSNVYYNSFYHGGPAVTRIENAQAATFTVLAGGYAKDSSRVYFVPNKGIMATLTTVTGADVATFNVLTEDNECAIDQKETYCQGKTSKESGKKIFDLKLYQKVKGKIIFLPESLGEAYYVSAGKKEIYALSRPLVAFSVMRAQGVGIKTSDLEKIPVSGSCPGYLPHCDMQARHDARFANAQKGKILIQVQGHGEAWYVNPSNGKRYFLGRPTDAFNLMKKLGMGISNGDYGKLLFGDETTAWANSLVKEFLVYVRKMDPKSPNLPRYQMSKVINSPDGMNKAILFAVNDDGNKHDMGLFNVNLGMTTIITDDHYVLEGDLNHQYISNVRWDSANKISFDVVFLDEVKTETTKKYLLVK